MTRTSTVTPDNVKEYLPCKSTSKGLITYTNTPLLNYLLVNGVPILVM